jgi:hypothetical protein
MANEEFFSGMIRTELGQQWLADNARAFGGTTNRLTYAEEFDPRPIIRKEDQRRRNSCVGNGVSSCGEMCAWLDSGGELKVQFSRWGMYILAQTLSGPRPGKTWLGADQGAGVDGAIKAAVKWGFPLESAWAYPADNERYSTKIPDGALETGEPFKLQQHAAIRSYDEGFEWVTQGKGALLIGIDWTTGLDTATGDIRMSELKTRVIGGHCEFIAGWDKDGKMWVGNSHLNREWRKAPPEVIDYWAKRGEVYGLSDLKDVKASRIVVPADYGIGW